MKFVRNILLMFILVLFIVTNNRTTNAQSSNPSSEAAGTLNALTMEIPEKRFGGSMMEDGTWAIKVGLKILPSETGQDLSVKGTLEIYSPGLAYHLKQKIIKGIFILLIGERVFDDQGYYKYGQNVFSSGFLTDTGLPIEGVTRGLPTDAFGGNIRHPINRIITIPPDDLTIKSTEGTIDGKFAFDFQIPTETPSGWYRFSMLVGVQLDETQYRTFWNEDPNVEELLGNEGSDFQLGLAPVGNVLKPHLPWVLMPDVIPGGGILSRSEKQHFGITNRLNVTSRAVIPLMEPEGGQIQYRLEPALPFLSDEKKSPIALDITKGEIAIKIKTPKGNKIDLGKAQIKGWDGDYLSTGNNKFNFAFSEYGHHEIEVTGFIKNKSGLIIGGGGIYDVDIANNLNIITTLVPGFPFKQNENRDISLRVIPPVPAKIRADILFNPWSQKGKLDRSSLELSCNEWGIYTPSGEQIKKRWSIPEFQNFNRPGEYRVDITAEYKDKNGVLYKGTKTLAGIVTSDKHWIEIRGENPSERKTESGITDVLTIPPDSGSIIAFPPKVNLIFDPNLKVILTDKLRDERILASDKSIELSDGLFGYIPRSTSITTPAHWYPENVDRRMYAYSTIGAMDGRSMFLIKDGGSMSKEMEPFTSALNFEEGDYFTIYGSMVLRDYPLDKVYYSSFPTGAIVLRSVNEPTLIDIPDGNTSLLGRETPFMHSFSFYPGAIIEKDKPFTPVCMVFPPQNGIIKIILTEPNGEKKFFTGIVDERGILDKLVEEVYILWQEGAHSVEYTFFPGILKHEELAQNATSSHTTKFPFYVVGNNRGNTFDWTIPNGSQIEMNTAITMNSVLEENTLIEGKAYFTVSFNGDLIETGEIPFAGNGFELSINIPRLIEKITNFNPKDKHDTLEIGCMVKGVNQKGKNRFLASRITINNGRFEY